MSDKSLHDLIYTELLVPGLVSKLSIEDLVVPIMCALEHLINLEGCLASLEALLDHIGRELQLTEAHKVACDEVQDLVVSHIALELENILDQVVAKWIFDQEVNAADYNISESQLLPHQALLEVVLHHTAAVVV